MQRQSSEKQIKLIPLENEHIDRVYEIERLSYSNPWTKFGFLSEVRNPFSLPFVLVLDDEIIGYIVLWDYGESLHIANITVHPDHRRKGYGRYMIKFAVEKAQEMGKKMVTLEVRESNMPARNLYESEGFEAIGKINGYYPDNRENAIIYRLKLED